MSAVLLGQVHAHGGDAAVKELLQRARCKRAPEYLLDIGNWISYDEAVALWAAGAEVTHNPRFARSVGEEAARRLGGSSVATLLRSLGSPEAVYRQIATGATKFSMASELEATEVGDGSVVIVATAVEGFPRSRDHCEWTCGLLATTTLLFGLPPARVEHDECAALGAPACRYRVSWTREDEGTDHTAGTEVLRSQLAAAQERLEGVYQTAADLIGVGDLADVLARITDRAAVEVRATQYLLAVCTRPGGEIHVHHKGFPEEEVAAYAERILHEDPADLPEEWLVAPICSKRNDYGRLLAMFGSGHRFFPQERELLEVYTRYAASALDSATALLEAQERYEQSSTLLELARELAVAGTSGEIARRLVDAVPRVVDCDRVSVYLWDTTRNELVRRAVNALDPGNPEDLEEWSFAPTPGGPLERLLNDPTSPPLVVDHDRGDPMLRELAAKVGAVATILVPLSTPDAFLGGLVVGVVHDRERLQLTPDLLDRLSGVAAQATTALQNGRLVDQITHLAMHDELTGLANRLRFTDALRSAITRARSRAERVTLFYVDLDGFKPVNDEFGHEAGDDLLVAIGQRLTASTRTSDVVARLGGDEFGVLVSHEAWADADLLAQRLEGAFTSPFAIAGHELPIGASIGRASFPADADSADGLLRLADAAMFEAKRGRRAIHTHAG